MYIDTSEITLSIVSIRLDSKKFSSSILDQIPRLDFCKLLLDEDDCYDSTVNIAPVCRFSLSLLLDSHKRVSKAMGYTSFHIERLMQNVYSQEEAFLFNHKGQLYCDSFSSKTGTQEYGNQRQRLQEKVFESERLIAASKKVIDLDVKGFNNNDIVKLCGSKQIKLCQGPKRKKTQTICNYSSDDILGFDATDDELSAHELNTIIKNYGSWGKYINYLKQEIILESNRKLKYKIDIEQYDNHVSTVIAKILSAPFTILGC